MKLILVAVVSGALSTSAYAGDIQSNAVHDWSGVYVGAQAGYALGKSDSGGFFLLAPGSDVTGALKPEGFTGGLYAGYNLQFGSPLVFGVEGDIEYADIKGSSALYLNGAPVLSNEMSSEMNWKGSVRARVGYAIDRLLPYVTAGVAFGNYEIVPKYELTGPLPGSKAQIGPTVGVGVEYAITDRINTRIEYRCTDFGDASYAILGFGGFLKAGLNCERKTSKWG